METSNTQLLERISESTLSTFGIYTFNEIIMDAEAEFAVDLYNSDGVFCLTKSYKSFKQMPSFEVLLDHKPNLPFPADIHHLNIVRNAVLSAEFCAEHSYGDDYHEEKFKEDPHLYAEEFSAYYHFFPELMDENRQEIHRLLMLMRQRWQALQVNSYIEICEEIRGLIDPMLRGITEQPIDRFYTNVDVSRFNPNLQNAD